MYMSPRRLRPLVIQLLDDKADILWILCEAQYADISAQGEKMLLLSRTHLWLALVYAYNQA
jgi:hypothetical protein